MSTKRKKSKISELLKIIEEGEERRKKRWKSTKRCPVCGQLLRGYTNLARHLTRVEDLKHPDYVERIAGNSIACYSRGGGGQRKLAEILENIDLS